MQKYGSLETKMIQINVCISMKVFLFCLFKNSCDIRISTFIVWNLIKLCVQHSINVVDLYRRKFCDGHNALVIYSL